MNINALPNSDLAPLRDSPSSPAWLIGSSDNARTLHKLVPTLQTIDATETTPVDALQCVCVVPSIPEPLPANQWTSETLEASVEQPLLWTVTELQTVISRLIETERPGRLVVVLPSDHAMGVDGNAAAGTVCGGILSMCRTLSMELKRKSIAVNVLLVDTDACLEGPEVAASLRQQLALLLDLDSWMTGQEIWVADGSELGRKRP
jgi:hypothetical protein